jgi:WD40 repeat protein
MSADGSRVASAAWSKDVAIWDVNNEKLLHLFACPSRVYSVALNAAGTQVLAGMGTLDFSTDPAKPVDCQTCVYTLGSNDVGTIVHNAPVVVVGYQPGEKTFYDVAAIKGKYEVYRIDPAAQTSKMIFRATGGQKNIAVSSDLVHVASDNENTLNSFHVDPEGRELEQALHDTWYHGLAYMPDNRRLVTAEGGTGTPILYADPWESGDDMVRGWMDLSHNIVTMWDPSIKPFPTMSIKADGNPKKYDGPVGLLSADHQSLFIIYSDGSMKRYDLATGNPVETIHVPPAAYYDAVLSADAKSITAKLGPLKQMQFVIMDLATGKPVWQQPAQDVTCRAVTDGTLLYVGLRHFERNAPDPPGKVSILRFSDGKELDQIDLGPMTPRAIAVSPNGAMMGICADARGPAGQPPVGMTLIADVRTHKIVYQQKTPGGSAGRNTSLAITDSGCMAISQRERAVLFDAAQPDAPPRIVPTVPLTPTDSIAFTPDGKSLLAHSNYDVQRFDVATGKETGHYQSEEVLGPSIFFFDAHGNGFEFYNARGKFTVEPLKF